MEKSGGGISFVSLLTILFIGLKLTSRIDWSWWWVLSPVWIGFSLSAIVFLIALLVMYLEEKKRRKYIKKLRSK
ncbi:hypothetical protein [Oceanobacillus neutriphilus]|uniref:Transmembrane Fragile-X-F protein n=1 Tax=Oceanobacillus neutriphilus TaxID=531815 RepID=A0ABQ2P1Y6_9BACI|nr:hypothetical protein [Oceanobacillus neutriphilus]GGP16271.1 hypothetical protein GCM10011346_47580 [Oceanobacillus neutriphilus]